MINRKKHSDKTPAKQGADAVISEPNKIGPSTPYDFDAKNLTAYGGLLPVAAMLERLAFQQLVEETLTVKRITRAMPMYQFVLAMVLAAYVGFTRLHHLRFIAREPMLTGILKVLRLPPGFAAPGYCQTIADRAAANARARVAGGACGADRDHARH